MKKTLIFYLMSLLTVVTLNAQNLISGWDGDGVTGDLSKPNDVGWLNTVSESVPWNTANASSGCRYRDADVGFASGTFTNETDGSVNDSRQMMLRFDNSAYSSSVYAYPVTLESNTTYTFTMDFLCGGSATPPKDLTVGASTTASSDGMIYSQTFTSTSSPSIYKVAELTFTSGTTAGTYYITMAGDFCWFGITNLDLEKSPDQLTELNNQYDSLSLGDISDGITSDLSLPTTLGTKGVTVRWASSNMAVIDTLGKVTQPAKYDKIVVLTATLSQTIGDKVYTLTKTFNVKVLGIVSTPLQIATFNFNSSDISLENDTLFITDENSGFKGHLMNGARIRTIGTTDKINVLDLGDNNGYFDMGQDIGQAIYALSDFTMMGYFYIDSTYTNLSANGNYYWNFSNSDNVGTDKNGFMYGRINSNVACGMSATGSPSTAAATGSSAPTGAWHHITYTLSGTTGTVYIDGVQVAQNTASLVPNNALAKDSMMGTICNWLGRSGWSSDAYLQKTLLYDFRILSFPLTVDDINNGYEGFDPVQTTLDRLNAAYAANSDYVDPNLPTEKDNLTLGDLSAVTSDLTLPTQGTLDNTIKIIWQSSNDSLISSTGVVHRQKYFNYPVVLTATLIKNGQSVTKTFNASVVAQDGTGFTGDLMVKYDFNNVQDSIVTDEAEKHFEGVLKNQATVNTIGDATTGTYNVLNLGDSIGYFDMGKDMGAIMYNLTDFTVGAYFRIADSYADLASNGNFLWTFSNSTNSLNDGRGYMFGSLKNEAISITAGNYTSQQGISLGSTAAQGSWHYIAYTQKDTIGTLYIDGFAVNTGTVKSLLAYTLPQSGQLGTMYNWLGRSCYSGDVYLRQTLVYDFRIYDKALTDADFVGGEMDVPTTIGELDAAYAANTAVSQVKASSYYKIITNNHMIELVGLKGTENVNVFDITGRKIASSVGQNTFNVNAGIYFVKVNNTVTKVMVE